MDVISFNDMKQKYHNVGTVGQQLKYMSDEVMQETFDNDVQTRQCFIYDYYHDDQSDTEYGYNPYLSKTKIPVKLKFIVKSYKSLSSDDPEYHIQFEPDVWNSMSCKPDWFVKNYEKLGIKFPVGLYVDIPDDRGVYYKWIVMYGEVANQFPKFGVLRCNYLFTWIKDNGSIRYRRKVWGIEATQNSYTSGVWTGDKFTLYEEQGKFYLPWSPISTELKHDMRLFISMLQEEPYVYKITKIKNTSPKGVITFTVKQDTYEPAHDYVCLNPIDEDYGCMFADYYSSDVEPIDIVKDENMVEDFNNELYRLVIEAPTYIVRLGASKVLTAKIYDGVGTDITEQYSDEECAWSFDMEISSNTSDVSEESNETDKTDETDETTEEINIDDLIVIDDEYSLEDGNKFKCKFRFDGDEEYLDHNIMVTCTIKNYSTTISLDIMTL